ncbi:MAG TPA: glycogen/starch/alpha-glucan phosphorylase, partial [Syntrophorhabdaceae bacterium]|nr:glycogen/starch/alpha-glucan phosphorylase [Syntrophorhabdaceae bacterium]
RPRDHYETDERLKEALDLIASGRFSRGDGSLFRPLVDTLLDRDEYLLLADYASYIEMQDEVNRAYLDAERWVRMSILNVARTGKFSSDRSILEYAEGIWNVVPGE